MTPAEFENISPHTICAKKHATKVTFPVFIKEGCFVTCELAAGGKTRFWKTKTCLCSDRNVVFCVFFRKALTLNNYDGDCGSVRLVG